jgi:hypothetical protein
MNYTKLNENIDDQLQILDDAVAKYGNLRYQEGFALGVTRCIEIANGYYEHLKLHPGREEWKLLDNLIHTIKKEIK